MSKKIVKTMIVSLGLCCALQSYASVSSDLGNFFDGLGYSDNATNPTAYQGQSAGYYTGGSLYARDTVRDYQLLSINMPSVNAGCSGIDLYTGSFSFINSDELIDAFKNIGNNALSYAFMLGMESMVPEAANGMQYFQSMANKVNRANIQSCQSAASLVGAAWPKTQVAQQQVCETLGSANNIFSDYAEAKQGCGTGVSGKSQTNTLNQLKDNPDYKNMILEDTNIAWQATQKSSFLSGDSELSELFMSLSGSIIVKSGGSDSAPNQYAQLPSLANQAQLIKAILYGGTTSIYLCDDTKDCLNPHKGNITISASDGLSSQVRQYLDDIEQKILTDTELTTEEQGFLQSTSLPIYKMLNVESAYANGADILDLDNYADMIASDILQQYLKENLDIIQQSADILQYPPSVMHIYQSGIEKARASVNALYQEKMQSFNSSVALVERTRLLEKELAGRLSSQLSQTMNWSQGLQ